MSLSVGLRRLAVVVFYAAVAVPLFMMGEKALQSLSLQSRSEDFPTARGVVTLMHTETVGTGKRTHTALYFEARYVVRGQTFITDRLDFRAHRSRWLFEGSPDWMVAQYPVGSEVHIAFDPERPEVAALAPGFVAAELGGHAMLFPFYLLAIGVLALPWFLIRPPKTSPPEHAEDPLSQAKTAVAAGRVRRRDHRHVPDMCPRRVRSARRRSYEPLVRDAHVGHADRNGRLLRHGRCPALSWPTMTPSVAPLALCLAVRREDILFFEEVRP
jgi:hypothetical protein